MFGNIGHQQHVISVHAEYGCSKRHEVEHNLWSKVAHIRFQKRGDTDVANYQFDAHLQLQKNHSAELFSLRNVRL